MSHTRYSDLSLSPKSGGSGGNSHGSTTPRGSFRSSREDLLNESYGTYGSNPDLGYNINDELDDWRHGIDRRGSYSAYKEGRLFTDVLDELEYQIRKAEDDSTSLIHDFNVIRNQHQSQSRRINDLARGFEEARYTLDHMRTGRYRKKSQARPGSGEERGLRRESLENFGRRGSIERFDRRISMERMERHGSHDRIDRRGSMERVDRRDSFDKIDRHGSSDRVDRHGSSDRMDRYGSSDRMDRHGNSDRMDRHGSSDRMDRYGSSDRMDRYGSNERLGTRGSFDRSDRMDGYDDRGYRKTSSDHSYRSPDHERPLKSKGSSRSMESRAILSESHC